MNILFKKLKCIELKIQQKIKDTAFLCFVGKMRKHRRNLFLLWTRRFYKHNKAMSKKYNLGIKTIKLLICRRNII